VALLGIVYTTLARVSIEGLRAEGESRRRLQASLVADVVLSELETGFAAGVVPEVGEEQREFEEFTIDIAVTLFAFQGTANLLGLLNQANTDVRPGSALLDPSGVERFAPNKDIEDSPVRRIEVRVSWFEGSYQREAIRTTFAYDAAAMAALEFSDDTEFFGERNP
jgi:hypothetical protein